MRLLILSLFISSFAFAAPSSNRVVPGQYLKNGTGLLTIPANTTDTLVGKATTDVFTNKSIAAGTNTITGLTAASMSASAAIDFSKLAALTSAHILVGSAGNVATDVAVSGDISLSNVGVVPIAKGGSNNASLAVTAGGMLYTDGTKFVNLGAGTAGQVPVSAAASPPVWTTLTAPTKQIFTATGTTTGYWFTHGSASYSIGDIYQDTNSKFYSVMTTCVACTSGYFVEGTGNPFVFPGGNLTKLSGSGTVTLTPSVSVTLGSYTTPANAKLLKITVVGGGAGGGGTNTVASSCGFGPSGGGGGTVIKWIANPTAGAAYFYNVGTGGAGGGASASSGVAGVQSNFLDANGTLLLAAGGASITATFGAVTTFPQCSLPASINVSRGGAASGGDLNIPGGGGGHGCCLAIAQVQLGNGGNSALGQGAPALGGASGVGRAGGAYGGGGSGGYEVSASAAAAGGAGADGVVIVEEYYQ